MGGLIQLLIMPFSYDGSILRYAGRDVLPIEPQNFIIIVIMALFLSIIAVLFFYKIFIIGIGRFEKVYLKYTGDYKKISQKLAKILRQRCDTLDVKIKLPSDQKILCYKKTPDEDTFLEITFKPDLDIMTISFKPENEDSMALVNSIRNLINSLCSINPGHGRRCSLIV